MANLVLLNIYLAVLHELCFSCTMRRFIHFHQLLVIFFLFMLRPLFCSPLISRQTIHILSRISSYLGLDLWKHLMRSLRVYHQVTNMFNLDPCYTFLCQFISELIVKWANIPNTVTSVTYDSLKWMHFILRNVF